MKMYFSLVFFEQGYLSSQSKKLKISEVILNVFFEGRMSQIFFI